VTPSTAEELAFLAIDAADRGEIVEGELLARRAVALAATAVAGTDEAGLSLALQARGTLERMVGRYVAAAATFQRALVVAQRAFGPESPEVAGVLNDLGMTFKFAGRFDEAETAYAQALTIVESQPDPDPDDLASLYHNLGGLAHAVGEHERAEPLARRSIELRERIAGPRAVAVLLDRSAYAAILDALQRPVEAAATIRDLLDDLVVALGSDHPEVGVALNNLAAIVQRRGDLGEAEALYRRVVAINESRFGAGSARLAVPLNNLATVLRKQDRLDEAERLYRRALALLEAEVAPEHPNLRVVRANLARLHASPRRPRVRGQVERPVGQ
jgi:tetratricopeptide (TPR) repeat protein